MRSFLDPDLFLPHDQLHLCFRSPLLPRTSVQDSFFRKRDARKGSGAEQKKAGGQKERAGSIGGGGKAERAGSLRWFEEDGEGDARPVPHSSSSPVTGRILCKTWVGVWTLKSTSRSNSLCSPTLITPSPAPCSKS